MDTNGKNCDVKHDPVFENEYCIGVPSINSNPKTLTGAYVIIPKSHVESPFEMSIEEWIACKVLMDKIKSYLDEKYKPDGYNLGWNVGSAAGQEVEYAHLHIIPRYKDEPYAGKGIRYWLKQEENIRPNLKNESQ